MSLPRPKTVRNTRQSSGLPEVTTTRLEMYGRLESGLTINQQVPFAKLES